MRTLMLVLVVLDLAACEMGTSPTLVTWDKPDVVPAETDKASVLCCKPHEKGASVECLPSWADPDDGYQERRTVWTRTDGSAHTGAKDTIDTCPMVCNPNDGDAKCEDWNVPLPDAVMDGDQGFDGSDGTEEGTDNNGPMPDAMEDSPPEDGIAGDTVADLESKDNGPMPDLGAEDTATPDVGIDTGTDTLPDVGTSIKECISGLCQSPTPQSCEDKPWVQVQPPPPNNEKRYSLCNGGCPVVCPEGWSSDAREVFMVLKDAPLVQCAVLNGVGYRLTEPAEYCYNGGGGMWVHHMPCDDTYCYYFGEPVTG